MTTDPGLALDVILPVLLRPGRGVYGLSIREALAEAGFTDMPPNGGYVLGLVTPDGTPARGEGRRRAHGPHQGDPRRLAHPTRFNARSASYRSAS
jgi:hypothetical protein